MEFLSGKIVGREAADPSESATIFIPFECSVHLY